MIHGEAHHVVRAGCMGEGIFPPSEFKTIAPGTKIYKLRKKTDDFKRKILKRTRVHETSVLLAFFTACSLPLKGKGNYIRTELIRRIKAILEKVMKNTWIE